MAVLTHDALLGVVKELIGDRDDDRALEIIGDVTDTISGSEDWKSKYEENDSAWRKKYRDRFFAPTDEEKVPESTVVEEVVEETEGTEIKTFDELFEVEE